MDNLHVMLFNFLVAKRDINVVQFSLLIVVWSNFQKLEHFFVEFKVKEIQTCAQFCVNISMYFIAKIMQ